MLNYVVNKIVLKQSKSFIFLFPQSTHCLPWWKLLHTPFAWYRFQLTDLVDFHAFLMLLRASVVLQYSKIPLVNDCIHTYILWLWQAPLIRKKKTVQPSGARMYSSLILQQHTI